MSRAGYSLHDSVSYWLNRLLSAVRDLLDDAFDEYDITSAQWTVLVSLYRRNAETPAGLAGFIGIDRSAVTRLLDRLEDKRLVRREQHGLDRRSIVVRLTQAGLDLTPKLVRRSKEANRRLTRGMSPAEAGRFQTTIRRMITNLR